MEKSLDDLALELDLLARHIHEWPGSTDCAACSKILSRWPQSYVLAFTSVFISCSKYGISCYATILLQPSI